MIVKFENFMTGESFEIRRLNYLQKIAEGEIEAVNQNEKLWLIAAGNSKRENVLAARRVIFKRLIRTGLI